MKTNHAVRGFSFLTLGIILTLFLYLFFSGFGFWVFPGLLVLFLGLGDVLFVSYKTATRRGSGLIHGGLLTLFLGIAMYLSLAGHVMLGLLQMVSLGIIAVGVLLSAAGAITNPKA